MTTTTNEQTAINIDENPTRTTNTVGVDELLNTQPTPTTTAAVDELIHFQPTPANTDSVNEPINFQPPPTDTTAVDKPINLQQTSASTTAVNESKNVYPPLTNITASDDLLNSQPRSEEPLLAENTAIPKSVEHAVIIDDTTNLTAPMTSNLPRTNINKRASLIAILCGSLIGIIIFSTLAIIPLLQLIIGWRYADECPIYWRIPHYLVVEGAVELVALILVIIQDLLKLYANSKPNTRNSAITGVSRIILAVLLLLTIFTMIWFIAGCIWVFGVWNEVQYSNPDRSDYCNRTVYRSAFWLLLFSIFEYLSICCRLCKQKLLKQMSKKVLTKKELEILKENSDELVKFVEKKKTSGSSEWWKYYHSILVDGHLQQFVSCNSCKTLLAFSSANGTNNLRTHFNSCTKTDKSSFVHQRTVHDFYSSSKELEI